jgi:subtilisin
MTELPAYGLGYDDEAPQVPSAWPQAVSREWAWGGSAGEGVTVCLVDSGVRGDHPLVGGIDRAVTVTLDADGEPHVQDDETGDVSGHGTACAGIVRAIAPAARITSVRVLDADLSGGGTQLLAGLGWALEQGYEVVNLSLSTTRRAVAQTLHELADSAYFARTLLVACANNRMVDSYPWKFSSVVSVASHAGADPMEFFYNPDPPVEFLARGVDVDVAWPSGGTMRATGNSFAAPHVAAICALILAKHPELTPFQVKGVLFETASNVVREAA